MGGWGGGGVKERKRIAYLIDVIIAVGLNGEKKKKKGARSLSAFSSGGEKGRKRL